MTTQAVLTCNDALRAQLAERLADFEREAPVATGTHEGHAAVALTVVDVGFGADLDGLPRHGERQRDAALVLTRRAETLRRHAGQWALPGGRLDDGETPAVAALRELHAEIGLRLGDDAVLGKLSEEQINKGQAVLEEVRFAVSFPFPDEPYLFLYPSVLFSSAPLLPGSLCPLLVCSCNWLCVLFRL